MQQRHRLLRLRKMGGGGGGGRQAKATIYFAVWWVLFEYSSFDHAFPYSTHCNTAQIWSWFTRYSSSLNNKYPVIYVILCLGEKNGKLKVVPAFLQ